MNEPKLRFPEFTGEWQQCKLGDIGSVSMCRRIFKEQTTENGDIPFYKIGTFGGKADAYISKDLFEEYKAKYPFPKIGDILISASGSIGRTVEFNGENAYFQDSNIVWLNHDERVDNGFLKQFYSIVKWSGLEGSAIKRLYNNNILKTEISLPSLPEQQKIASLFTELDILIQSAEKELEGYRELKQGMLQKMFPKKGETVPEIRFPEFSGEWENRKLSDIAVLTSSKRIHAEDYVETGIPFYRGKEISELKEHKPISEVLYIAEYKYNEISSIYGSPKKGDLLITAVGTLGNTWVIDQTPFYFKDGNLIWFKDIKCNPNYLDYAMSTADGQKKIMASAIGSSQKALTMVKLNELEFMFPEKKEQDKIAKYFSYLDNLITSQQQELDGYKELKKGLLQQMFC